jgi:hypothetical protein
LSDFLVGEISSAYFEAFTFETVWCLAGTVFGPLAGHLSTIVHALYGLRTSGSCWHEHFADVMNFLGITPSKADPDVWMHDCITHYEYVPVYVDESMFIGKEPQPVSLFSYQQTWL